ncbi:hypothetical protein [Sabulibacter ruber]|uniref:hypothetical protein n=1 Tax=Sabulibacter ruber TaxID=2811901 RepID=UPI001A972496|nr:hypothetical protein [Sabulibacter ruber]
MKPRKRMYASLPGIVATCTVLVVLLPIFLITPFTYAQQSQAQEEQDSEFKTHPNGLIYSTTTISQLKGIVDSLSLKFKVCELHKDYRALPQTKGHYVRLEKGNISAAVRDLKQNISFEEFVKKYAHTTCVKDLLVAKTQSESYDGKKTVEFFSLPLNGKGDFTLEVEATTTAYEQPLKGKWIFEYWDKTAYSDEKLEAFYFPEEFKAPSLPIKYARMVQYADCMIDTTAQIYLESDWGRASRPEKTPAALDRFMNYVHQATNMPVYDEKNESYYEDYYHWYHVTRKNKVQNDLSNRKEFTSLLAAALPVALQEGGYDEEFEEYVGQYISKKTELELKRKRQVVGSCSQDTAPREHAVAIAQLSAETVNWETFLRAHLDIMNDRFDRASDGSYAWAGRKTYIRELEVLDINVPDLLIGISLRLENSGENHYYGNIGRLGRALSESQHATTIESQLLTMIKDKQLDDYNRILLYYLFLNYNHHLADKSQQKTNVTRLNEAVQHLPTHLAARALVKE